MSSELLSLAAVVQPENALQIVTSSASAGMRPHEDPNVVLQRGDRKKDLSKMKGKVVCDPSVCSHPAAEITKGGTGFGVRLLADLAANFSTPAS